MTALYNLFEQIHPLSVEFWNELQSIVKQRKFPRKTVLLKGGDVCREIHFLVSGLARAYYFKGDEDITSWIMRDNDLIISVRSFFQQQPAHENIELLEDATLVSLNYEQLTYLYRKYKEFNFVGRVLTERYYIMSEERTYAIRMQTARLRYDTLFKKDPEIFRRVPLKYIASYLGMKPETLSRIRALE